MTRPRIKARKVRVVAGLVLGAVLLFVAAALVLDEAGGASDRRPEDLATGLSPEASELVRRAYEGIDPARLVDVHTHVLGMGVGGTGCWVNARMRSWLHPIHHLRYRVFADAAGIEDVARGDELYVERLTALVDGIEMPGRFFLLAFDQRYGMDGVARPDDSEFYVPNDYVWSLCERDPRFLPAISVHPYREDALAELDRWAGRAHLVKWLPNAMGIDPADPRCAPFYAKMREHGMVLLSHAGVEKAVHAEDDQKLGNPLRLRAALDAGVKVIVAHCASLGDGEDLDAPDRPRVSNFRLFLRLMDDERYDGLVFGEISAITQVNRFGEALPVLLEREDLHARLVNGSDYPLPAVNAVISTRALVARGFLTRDERRRLNEIYEFNPLLFDLVLKRTLRSPATGRGFAPEVFEARPELGL